MVDQSWSTNRTGGLICRWGTVGWADAGFIPAEAQRTERCRWASRMRPLSPTYVAVRCASIERADFLAVTVGRFGAVRLVAQQPPYHHVEHRHQHYAEHRRANHAADHAGTDGMAAVGAGTARDRQRQHAEDEGDRGHHDW